MKRYLILPVICSALLLTGCPFDGGRGNSTTRAVTNSAGGSPSLGLVSDATANFYQADGITLLGTTETGTDGSVTVNVGSYNGPVVIEVLGDDVDAMYFDESLATQVPFAAGQSMHALLPSPSNAGITILTELAYQAAVRQNLFPISASAVNELNEIVRAALAPGLSSILSVPTLLGDPSVTTLDNSEAGNYALVLAALAELGASDPGGAPALAVMNALVADLADGDIDGDNDGTPVSTPYSNFLNEMQTNLGTMATTYSYSGTADDQKPVSSSVDTSNVLNPAPPPTGSSGDLVCNSQAATLNSALAGDYTLNYTLSEAGGPFTDGQQVSATVNANGTLQINGTTLTNPAFCVFSGTANTAEIIWADTAAQIQYALTDNNTGNFNEINVGDASRPRDFSDTQLPTFLGQLRIADSGAGNIPPEILALAGDYSPSVVKKSGPFSFTSGFTLNQALSVSIDETSGVVTVDGQYVFDPSDDSYVFSDRLDQSVSRYQIDATEPGSGSTMTYQIYIENGDVIAHSLRIGGSQTSYLEAEQKPLPQEYSDFFAAMNALNQPVNLVLVSDDTSYTSGLEGSSQGQCVTIAVRSNNGGSASNVNQSIPFQLTVQSEGKNPGDYNFFRSSDRLTTSNGDQTLTFGQSGIRLILRANGEIDLEATFLGELKDRATTNSSDIDSAGCATEPDAGTDQLPAGGGPFDIVYAGDMPGIDQRFDVSAIFDPTSFGLLSYAVSPQSTEKPELGTATDSEQGGTDSARIGRWNNGVFAGSFYSRDMSENTAADQGFHYGIGLPASNIPSSGTQTFNVLSAATNMTQRSGGMTPGTGQTITPNVTVDFANSKVDVDISFQINGNTFSCEVPDTNLSPSMFFFASCADGVVVRGIVVADGADELILSYTMSASGSTERYDGAALITP